MDQHRIELVFKWEDYHFQQFVEQAAAWFTSGTVIALIGFLLPWFREDTDYGWSYGGWGFLFDEVDRHWLAILIAILYIFLIVSPLLRFISPTARAVLGLITMLATITFVGFAAAYANNPRDTIEFGIPVMIVGGAFLLWGIMLETAARVVRQLTVVERHHRVDS